MTNSLFAETEASYQKLVAAMSVAESCSSKGIVFEAGSAVRKVSAALNELGQCFKYLEQSLKLYEFIDKAKKEEACFDERLAKVWSYLRAPETFLAEAYLVSAENALVNNGMFHAANAYKHIKPGENMRTLLDAQDSPEHNLKERAGKLDQLIKIIENHSTCSM